MAALIFSLLRLLSVFSVAVIASATAHACSCGIDGGSFFKFSEGQTVIRGTVESLGPPVDQVEGVRRSINVSVDEVVTGQFDEASVELLGDRGWDCLEYLNEKIYYPGSQHLFILFSNAPSQGLTVCGEASLQFEEDQVKGVRWGARGPREYSIAYDKYVRRLTHREAKQ